MSPCAWCGEVHAADFKCATCRDCDAPVVPPLHGPALCDDCEEDRPTAAERREDYLFDEGGDRDIDNDADWGGP